MLRFGIHLPPFADPAVLVDVTTSAEGSGWDGVFLWDNAVGVRFADVEHIEESGAGAGLPMSDPWVLLGALALLTERIRLGTAVTPLPHRRVQKVARETVTVDRLSGGRLTLGVGPGSPVGASHGAWHGASGAPDAAAAQLAERLDESLDVLVRMWSGKPVNHEGGHLRVTGGRFLPVPLQHPRIPVWVGCTLPNLEPLARAARWDGVLLRRTSDDGHVQATSADDVEAAVAELRLHRETLTRFGVAVVNPFMIDKRQAAAYEAAGTTWHVTAAEVDDLRHIAYAGPP